MKFYTADEGKNGWKDLQTSEWIDHMGKFDSFPVTSSHKTLEIPQSSTIVEKIIAEGESEI